MQNKKILYVTTEMSPYQEDSNMATTVNKMALKMHQAGNDVRVFMPRFGSISERRFQLHEVIRLSGMNIIINDLDQPLIIKVASLPGERLQVYFIDNDEYFKRKHFYTDEEGQFFGDNDERAIFFARGVIETIKKLNWVPDIIHFNGWMSAMIPIYLKSYYKKDSYFNDTKMVMSLYNEVKIPFSKNVEEKLKFDNIDNLGDVKDANSETFLMESMGMVDVILKGDEFLEGDLDAKFNEATVQKSEYLDADSFDKIYQ